MMLLFLLLASWLLEVNSAGDNSTACDRVKVVSRRDWKARDMVREWPMKLPLNHVIILHTVTPFCKTKPQCFRSVQFVQDFHLDERGWWDIAYNFLVGGDGRIYEGRGWNRTGSHSINFNTNSLGLAFIGNFNNDTPTQAMIDAALNFAKCGVEKGYLSPSYEFHGHRDVACTESPGKNLYAAIRRWTNYKGGRLPLYNCTPLDSGVLTKE